MHQVYERHGDAKCDGQANQLAEVLAAGIVLEPGEEIGLNDIQDRVMKYIQAVGHDAQLLEDAVVEQPSERGHRRAGQGHGDHAGEEDIDQGIVDRIVDDFFEVGGAGDQEAACGEDTGDPGDRHRIFFQDGLIRANQNGDDRAEGDPFHASEGSDIWEGHDESEVLHADVPKNEAEEEQEDAEAGKAFFGKNPDDKRPDDIELLFDGQGPEMVERLYFWPSLEGVEPVFAVEPEPGLVMTIVIQVEPGMGQGEEQEGQADIIKGENADDTAADEFAVVAGFRL